MKLRWPDWRPLGLWWLQVSCWQIWGGCSDFIFPTFPQEWTRCPWPWSLSLKSSWEVCPPTRTPGCCWSCSFGRHWRLRNIIGKLRCESESLCDHPGKVSGGGKGGATFSTYRARCSYTDLPAWLSWSLNGGCLSITKMEGSSSFISGPSWILPESPVDSSWYIRNFGCV